jgi:hypothetical protein
VQWVDVSEEHRTRPSGWGEEEEEGEGELSKGADSSAEVKCDPREDGRGEEERREERRG